jgi:hypothetical protein
MAEETRVPSTEELDAQIKALQDQKAALCKLNKEPFCFKKLASGAFGLLDPGSWAKWFTTFVKTLLVLAVIAGLIFGYGYWRGKKKAVNMTPIAIQLSYGKEAMIQLDKEGKSFMHITKDGAVHVQDNADDKIAKIHYVITAKDIPAVWEKLKPYGFDLKAFLAAGGSIGASGAKAEVGVGMQWYKFYKANINSFITTAGIYPIGIGYRLTENIDALLV